MVAPAYAPAMSELVLSLPIGFVRLTAENGLLTGIRRSTGQGPTTTTDPLLQNVARQLADYFAGKRTSFDLPLAPAATPFQAAVRRALQKIPFGETMTYGQIAKCIGTKSSRAVGQAVGANPLCVVVPCHRVVAANGGIGGFAWGLQTKRRLLDGERRSI